MINSLMQRHGNYSSLYYSRTGLLVETKIQINCDVSLYDEVQQTEVNKEYMDNVKSYLGSAEQALDAARLSAKESEIRKILYHEGDPNKRNSMSFILQYQDGSISPPLVYGLVKYAIQ